MQTKGLLDSRRHKIRNIRAQNAQVRTYAPFRAAYAVRFKSKPTRKSLIEMSALIEHYLLGCTALESRPLVGVDADDMRPVSRPKSRRTFLSEYGLFGPFYRAAFAGTTECAKPVPANISQYGHIVRRRRQAQKKQEAGVDCPRPSKPSIWRQDRDGDKKACVHGHPPV